MEGKAQLRKLAEEMVLLQVRIRIRVLAPVDAASGQVGGKTPLRPSWGCKGEVRGHKIVKVPKVNVAAEVREEPGTCLGSCKVEGRKAVQ